MIAALLAATLMFGAPTHVPDPFPYTREIVVQPSGDEIVAVNFEQFFRAIADQESSNNYGAVGPSVGGDRAYGKYQVMDFNIPSWTSQYYGKSLTPQQFLNNSAAQEAVARGKLKSYWDKYGARGAAAAWYSGDPSLHMSTRSQSGGPSIKQYVDEVLATAAGMPSSGGGSSSSSGGGGGIVPSLDSQELAEQYGFASNFLDSVPELKRLFSSAVSEGWSKDKFTAKLRDTNWFKSTPAPERKILVEMYADPATWGNRWNTENVRIRQLANKLGIVESNYGWGKIHEATWGVLQKGWDDNQVRFFLGQFTNNEPDHREGEAGETYDQLKQYAYNMGVEQTDQWFLNASRDVTRGTNAIQDYKSQLADFAKAQFPQWTAQIAGGQSVADIAQPYLQSMAQILELPAGSVNLFDNTIKKAIGYTNEQTLTKEAKPLWQFENELRSDPRWKQTKNAQDSLMQVGHKVLADFGMAY